MATVTEPEIIAVLEGFTPEGKAFYTLVFDVPADLHLFEDEVTALCRSRVDVAGPTWTNRAMVDVYDAGDIMTLRIRYPSSTAAIRAVSREH